MLVVGDRLRVMHRSFGGEPSTPGPLVTVAGFRDGDGIVAVEEDDGRPYMAREFRLDRRDDYEIVLDDDPQAWLARRRLWAGIRLYDLAARAWMACSGHYLNKPPPQALFAVGVCRLVPGLFELVPAEALVGLAVIGRPSARALPQDGSWAELTRFALDPELPPWTASRVLRVVLQRFGARPRAKTLISYHDRSRHTGCIYKKAGFRKELAVKGRASSGWASRPGRAQSSGSQGTDKRRWRADVNVDSSSESGAAPVEGAIPAS